jgi:hypothetical protein
MSKTLRISKTFSSEHLSLKFNIDTTAEWLAESVWRNVHLNVSRNLFYRLNAVAIPIKRSLHENHEAFR